MLYNKKVLLILGGGISAYKSLDLIRRLREETVHVTPVMTEAASQFVTPLSVSALAGQKVVSNLFDLNSEAEMGHIQLSRSSDLVLVAPATANIIAKMANGHANDLASTVLLATDKPILLAAAMNVRMWNNPATKRNIDLLKSDGIGFIGPNEGDMACGEFGFGRMAEVTEILLAVKRRLGDLPLKGKRILITSGPTHEPIDPIRYLANRSSGYQGSSLAEALIFLGAEVIFVSGPSVASPPEGAEIISVETAAEMLNAVESSLPCDIAIFAAAVGDWKVKSVRKSKIKKERTGRKKLELEENADILARISGLKKGRPSLVIGFAAETDNIIKNATDKLERKKCDWIIANDVSSRTGIMGGRENQVTIITEEGSENWPRMNKNAVAEKLAQRISLLCGDK